MGDLETNRAFAALGAAERERTVDELIELVGAVDGLLATQVGHDIENLATYLDRRFTPQEIAELHSGLLAAKRWTFIESGVTHPRFQELFAEVTTLAQQEKVAAALAGLLGSASVAA